MKQIHDFQDFTVSSSSLNFTNATTLSMLHEKLRYTPFETLFIVDENNKLKGALTESDLKHARISIADAMNPTPKSVAVENCMELAEKIFTDIPSIRVIPVLDNDSNVVSLIAKDEAAHKQGTGEGCKWCLPFTQEQIHSVFEKHSQLDSWHYRSWMLNWGVTLDSRRFILNFISDNFAKDAKILDVACGTGSMCFYLANKGFSNLHGFDYSEELLEIGKDFLKMSSNEQKINFMLDNAFAPSFDVSGFNAAVFLGWVGCAAGFNTAFDETVPIHEIVDSLFETYSFSVNTHIFLDVYDDLSNYQIGKGKPAYRTVKQEDLQPVFAKHGYEIVDKCYDCDYKIKVIYVLKKVK